MFSVLLLPTLLLALGAAMLAYAWLVLADVSSYGAGFMPAVLGGLMLLLACLDLVASTRKPSVDPSDPPGPSARAILYGLGLTTAAVIFYLLAVESLGFLLTGSLIVVAMLAPLLQQHRLLILGVALLSIVGIDYLFSQLLLVPLPRGTLFS